MQGLEIKEGDSINFKGFASRHIDPNTLSDVVAQFLKTSSGYRGPDIVVTTDHSCAGGGYEICIAENRKALLGVHQNQVFEV